LHNKLTFLAFVVSLLAATAMAQMTDSYTVDTASNETLGTYLVNDTGFTLYYFANDAPGNGTSTCYGECVRLWPLFYAENIVVPEGLNETDFTAVEREDGEMQTAYKGWPLYFYYLDMKEGDVLGQGVRDVWFVVNPMDFPPVET
jgi:predicted lipoprotein with Yx(FWY)xxD motif